MILEILWSQLAQGYCIGVTGISQECGSTWIWSDSHLSYKNYISNSYIRWEFLKLEQEYIYEPLHTLRPSLIKRISEYP